MLDTPSSQSFARAARFQLLHFFREGFELHPLLTLVGIANVLVLLAALIGIVIDPRIITGVPAWVKPAKFAISITVYTFTLLWLLSFIKGHKRLVSIVTNVTALSMIIEMIVIVGQVLRGTSSHFNTITPFDRILYLIMAGFIALAFVMGIVAAVLLLLQRQPNRAFAWSLRLGLVITLVGMAVAFLMTRPTPAQLEVLQSGGHPFAIGAHSVGVPDGGPGLPFVGWSTEGGDLRIPHFVGLHALQVLPLFWWLFLRRRSGLLREGHRVALVWTASAAYLGLVELLTWQALRGLPIIAPDADTLKAFAILIGVTALLVVVIVSHARMRAGAV
jgi:hypothetical protein